MKNHGEMSSYEYQQVEQFIQDFYALYGHGLNENECHDELWISYLTEKKKYDLNLCGEELWQYIAKKFHIQYEIIRKRRNEKISIESKRSLNSKVGECKEEIVTCLPIRSGNFENSVILWEYAKFLGNEKYWVLRMMNEEAEEEEILEQLNLTPKRYGLIKQELQEDFRKYLYEI